MIADDGPLSFVILNEFFFSYHKIIDDNNFELIMKKSFELTEKKPNIVLFINLLHNIDSKHVTNEYIDKMKIYIKPIYDNNSKEIWNISTELPDKLYDEKILNFFSNETFVIMRGTVLYQYKKSTYFSEINSIEQHNYIIGFGQDEINSNLDEEKKEIANFFSDKISIEICLDIQKNIKVKKFQNIIRDGVENDIIKITELTDKIKDYSKKELLVIQSNSTNIYNTLDILPKDVIIAKCDPIQEIVFKINNQDIPEIINLEMHYSNLVQKEKTKGFVPINKVIRLNKSFEVFKNLTKSYNALKIIKDYKSNLIFFNNENHKFVLFTYDNLLYNK